MILKQQSFSNKLGENIVTVTNKVLHTFLKTFAVVKFLPCFTIIADTGKLMENFRMSDEGDISTRFLPLSVDFFLYINMSMWFWLLYLIKIFKMAAELCKAVLTSQWISMVIILKLLHASRINTENGYYKTCLM